ncbi:hypothetical protein [Paenibacillus favisporus]|uniref:hypothetical protein n=1 Tax=Paenibacillus favisporus TaxID=221028 RepID=UPI0013D3026B|nr:hypothetical protein [Paenibacillus favisporus]
MDKRINSTENWNEKENENSMDALLEGQIILDLLWESGYHFSYVRAGFGSIPAVFFLTQAACDKKIH